MKKITVTISLIFAALLAVHGGAVAEEPTKDKAAAAQSSEALAAADWEADDEAASNTDAAEDNLLEDLKVHII